MKFHNSIYVLFLCILCAVMGGCQDEVSLPQTDIPMEMMPFRLHTNLTVVTAETRASIVNGGEQTIDSPEDIILLCFDANGLYLGKYGLTDLEPNATEGINLKGTIKGYVPISTCRIHFIAKHNPNFSDVPLGTHENTLILSDKMAIDRTQNLCYWGYKSFASTDEMETWLSGENTIYLVRDRARVSLASVANPDTDADGNAIDEADKIKSIAWVASHGLSKGYLAPFDRNKLDTNPFEGYLIEEGGSQKYAGAFTPYEDAKCYKLAPLSEGDNSATMEALDFDPDEMTNVYADGAVAAGNYIYLFEDPNELPLSEGDGRTPVKLILKVTYGDDAVRYHPVLIMDQTTYEQHQIMRNYTYEIRINTLPKDLGKTSFEDAVNSSQYSNNQLLEVDKVVTDVSNGTYVLRIKGTNGTSTLYTERDADEKVRLDFEYKKMEGGVEKPVTDVDASNFTVRWLEVYNELVKDVDPEKIDITYDNTTGEGQLVLPISEVTTNLRSGQLLLTDKKVGLARYIYVYAIGYFDLGKTNVKLEQTDYTSNGKNVYKLTFTVPDEYPEGLYPLNFQFATRYLNAIGTNYEGGAFTTDAAFSVTVASTDPAKPQNTGLVSSVGTTDWNYDAADWNYWYTYSLPAKEGTGDQTFSVYLEDVTGSFSSITSLNQMGVFYRIKHFSYMDNTTLKNVKSATCDRK